MNNIVSKWFFDFHKSKMSSYNNVGHSGFLEPMLNLIVKFVVLLF